MSLVLSGTNGLSDVDGSAATPAIRGTDANTGIFFPAADTIAFAEGGVEVARFTSTGELTYTATTLASYQWSNWSPTNTTGTVTNAPSTGTADDSNYVTMANASGTLTITFDIAGKYFVCITQQTAHAQTYTNDRQIANLGGTSTRRISYNPTNSGVDSNDTNISISTGFYVVATAAQTLTVLPTYELTGAGTTAQHVAACNLTIQYCGG
jgi:hypothetical protein